MQCHLAETVTQLTSVDGFIAILNTLNYIYTPQRIGHLSCERELPMYPLEFSAPIAPMSSF